MRKVGCAELNATEVEDYGSHFDHSNSDYEAEQYSVQFMGYGECATSPHSIGRRFSRVAVVTELDPSPETP